MPEPGICSAMNTRVACVWTRFVHVIRSAIFAETPSARSLGLRHTISLRSETLTYIWRFTEISLQPSVLAARYHVV